MSNHPAQVFDRKALYTDTKRIINTHICQLLPLSIFFLPLSFSLLTFTGTLLESDFITNPTIPSYRSLLLPILYALFVVALALCGVVTITYTTYQAYCGGPVNVITSIKSLSRSFIHLASTVLAGLLSMTVICLVVAVSVQTVFKLVRILGFRVDTTTYCIILYSVIVAVAFVSILISFLTNWGLASAILVTESKWGFEPLWRSAYLLQGVRSESLFILLLSVTSIGIMIWSNSIIVLSFGISWWTNWALVFQAAAASCYIVLIMLQHVASNTVLYMHCKALHGELAVEKAAKEFSGGYISLRVDDETDKQQSSPTQVTKDEPNGVFEYLFYFLTVYWSLLGLFIYFF